MPQPRIVACPNCGSPVIWSEASPSRPFCSERCKLIDLAAWASERYRLPVAQDSGDEVDSLPRTPDDPTGT